MSFKADDEELAVEWMKDDSPQTPKCIIADAETSSSAVTIKEKVMKMKTVLTVGREVLGLVLGGNLTL